MEEKRMSLPPTVALDDCSSALVIIDQTLLPERLELVSLTTQEQIWDSIFRLRVRGAPAIGVAAAIGMYLAAKGIEHDDEERFLSALHDAGQYLASARPTAVNLFWAIKRMERRAVECADMGVPYIKRALLHEAETVIEEDIATCRAIGENGLSLLSDGMGLLTHCNAGQLATVKYGTALAPVHLGRERGMNFHVYADETRPLLQGARLTAFELASDGVAATLICDNMAATVMKQGRVQAVLAGSDRIAANGDVCNKIGTSGVAILAAHFGIPFYALAPMSTVDFDTPSGDKIPIEQRSSSEVTDMWYKTPMAPRGIDVFNPAFDVTDNSLVTAIITEKGIARPPFAESLAAWR